MGALIPYVTLPELVLLHRHSWTVLGRALELGPLSIKPFGTLVALGVYLGVVVTLRRARRLGFHPEAMSRFIFWAATSGFVFGHVLDTIFYHPEEVLRDPLSLVRIWDGLSSFGGFIGAGIGVFLFKYRFRVRSVMPFVDTVAASFPLGWVFGRTGCSVVHDHPGMRSTLWFAVQYPSGSRFDLGLYEMLFTVVLATVCLVLARRPRAPGFFLGLTMLVYAPVRFGLDFLRAHDVMGADPRYGLMTPAQWAAIAMGLAGFWFLYRACASDEVGDEPFRKAMSELDPKAWTRPNDKVLG